MRQAQPPPPRGRRLRGLDDVAAITDAVRREAETYECLSRMFSVAAVTTYLVAGAIVCLLVYRAAGTVATAIVGTILFLSLCCMLVQIPWRGDGAATDAGRAAAARVLTPTELLPFHGSLRTPHRQPAAARPVAPTQRRDMRLVHRWDAKKVFRAIHRRGVACRWCPCRGWC